MKDGKIHYYCTQIESYVLAFDGHIYIWTWPIVKVMHISNVNILEMVKDKALPSNMKSCTGFQIAYIHLTSTNYEGQSHACFDDEYLGNGDA